jgi:hypothetical protein
LSQHSPHRYARISTWLIAYAHKNSQTEGVGNEVRQRASKDLANNLNLAMVTIYTFLLFFCCFGCYKGEKPGNKGFSPATGSATG